MSPIFGFTFDNFFILFSRCLWAERCCFLVWAWPLGGEWIDGGRDEQRRDEAANSHWAWSASGLKRKWYVWKFERSKNFSIENVTHSFIPLPSRQCCQTKCQLFFGRAEEAAFGGFGKAQDGKKYSTSIKAQKCFSIKINRCCLLLFTILWRNQVQSRKLIVFVEYFNETA